MRAVAIVLCTAIPGLQVYLFRRIVGDLIKNHIEGPKGFRMLLAPWVLAGWCELIEDEIRFWNGSKIYLCHLQHEKDLAKYQGAEIHVLLIDELTHFTETMYRFLRGRVRPVGLNIPADYRGKVPRILCSANPGNIGHLWVKNTFISHAPPFEIVRMPAKEGGMWRQFIPARLDDNPSLNDDDPGYEARLEGLGSATLVAAMRWGDWDVVEGAFFDCWSNEKHVVAPFAIPDDWLRFRSADWGSYSPFSIGWWAVVQDDYRLDGNSIGVGRGDRFRSDSVAEMASPVGGERGAKTLPRGAIIRYREWYGASSPGKGLKLTADQVADGIIEREHADLDKDGKQIPLAYGVLDPSTFKEDGGPSIAERINARLIAKKLAPFREADNSRVSRQASPDKKGPMGGWDQMRQRLIGEGGKNGQVGTPLLYFFSTCLDSIRTIPVLQHDQARPEDLDTHSEDHAADDVRYACLSRPWTKTKIEPDAPKDAYQTPSQPIPTDFWKTM